MVTDVLQLRLDRAGAALCDGLDYIHLDAEATRANVIVLKQRELDGGTLYAVCDGIREPSGSFRPGRCIGDGETLEDAITDARITLGRVALMQLGDAAAS